MIKTRDLTDLLEILTCVVCGGPVFLSAGQVECRTCGHVHTVIEGVPVMLAESRAVTVMPTDHRSNPVSPELVDWLGSVEGYSLNLGAGATDQILPRCVEVEWSIFRNTDVVADAHRLPFHDNTFEAILTLNTFEHLHTPGVAARELYRVLKPGGKLVLQTAFLQPVHEAPHNYYNATEYGVRKWFADFDIERCFVPGNMNPAYVLGWVTTEILHHVGLERGWAASEALAATSLAQWRRLWVEPTARQGFLWDSMAELSQEAQARFSAGFQLEAVKPPDDTG